MKAARQSAQLPPRDLPEGGRAQDDDDLLPEIVFITACDQYAAETFEQGVADQGLKPAERDRPARVLAACSRECESVQGPRPALTEARNTLERVLKRAARTTTRCT